MAHLLSNLISRHFPHILPDNQEASPLTPRSSRITFIPKGTFLPLLELLLPFLPPTLGFLTLTTMDILAGKFFVGGERHCPIYWRSFSSILGLYPLHQSYPSHLWQPQLFPDIVKEPLDSKMAPDGKGLCYTQVHPLWKSLKCLYCIKPSQITLMHT